MNIINKIQLAINVWIQDSSKNQLIVQNSKGSPPSTDDLFWMLLGLGVGQHHIDTPVEVHLNSDQNQYNEDYYD